MFINREVNLVNYLDRCDFYDNLPKEAAALEITMATPVATRKADAS